MFIKEFYEKKKIEAADKTLLCAEKQNRKAENKKEKVCVC